MRHPWIIALAALALAAPAFADDEQSMPQPGAEHEKLCYFLGEWQGKEVFAKSEWMPEGAESIGKYRFQRILDGMFVEYDYETSGETFSMKGKGFYGFDQSRKVYLMSWYDSFGMSDHADGNWTDEGFVFEYDSQWGEKKVHNRSTIKILGDDQFSFVLGQIGPDGEFHEFMSGTYDRVAKPAPLEAAGPAGLQACCLAAIEKLAAVGRAPQCCGHTLDGKVEMHPCCKKKLSETLGPALADCCRKALLAADSSQVPPCCKATKVGEALPECCQPKK